MSSIPPLRSQISSEGFDLTHGEAVVSAVLPTPVSTVHVHGCPWVNPPVVNFNVFPNILPVNPFGIMGSTPITNPVTSLSYPLPLNPLVSPFPPITPVITSPFIPPFENTPFPLTVPTISSTHISPTGNTMLSSTPMRTMLSSTMVPTYRQPVPIVIQSVRPRSQPIVDVWPDRHQYKAINGTIPRTHVISSRLHPCHHCGFYCINRN